MGDSVGFEGESIPQMRSDHGKDLLPSLETQALLSTKNSILSSMAGPRLFTV